MWAKHLADGSETIAEMRSKGLRYILRHVAFAVHLCRPFKD